MKPIDLLFTRVVDILVTNSHALPDHLSRSVNCGINKGLLALVRSR